MSRSSTPLLRNERGVALVASILVLLALTALVSMYAMRTVSEKNVTVNHRVANRALYAADSGTEAAKQQITAYAQAKLDSLTMIWAGNGAIIPNPQALFPAGGLTTTLDNNPSYTATTTLVFEDSALEMQSQVFYYRYATTSNGAYREGNKRILSEGRLRVSATRGSFADYLIFTNTHLTQSNGAIWFNQTGNFNGRVHTNGQFRFAYSPTFHDMASSVAQKAWYYNNGNNIELDADRNGNVDVPNFYGGFERNDSVINLPTNSFSQQRAAIGGNPADTSSPTTAEINAALGTNPSSPNTTPPTGVYLPNSGGWITGGIYTQGDVKDMYMAPGANGEQIIRITDANNNQVDITIDIVNQTTTVQRSSGTTTYNGVPRGCNYVKGNVNSVHGPARDAYGNVQPAIASEFQMSIVSTGDCVIKGDIKYEDFNDGSNVLGIFSSGGDVRIATSAPNDLNIDAYVMAAADNKVFKVDSHDTGSYRGQVHLRGGMVTNYYGAFGTFGSRGQTGYGRDFSYDRRGFVPPYYPLTSRYTPDQPTPQVLAWREVTN